MRWFIVKLVPRRVWKWVWKHENIPLYGLAPFVLGRVLDSKPRKVSS